MLVTAAALAGALLVVLVAPALSAGRWEPDPVDFEMAPSAAGGRHAGGRAGAIPAPSGHPLASTSWACAGAGTPSRGWPCACAATGGAGRAGRRVEAHADHNPGSRQRRALGGRVGSRVGGRGRPGAVPDEPPRTRAADPLREREGHGHRRRPPADRAAADGQHRGEHAGGGHHRGLGPGPGAGHRASDRASARLGREQVPAARGARVRHREGRLRAPHRLPQRLHAGGGARPSCSPSAATTATRTGGTTSATRRWWTSTARSTRDARAGSTGRCSAPRPRASTPRARGVASIGDNTAQGLPDAAMEALAGYLRWKLAVHGVPLSGQVTLTSAGGASSRYAAGRRVRVPRVLGHRDTNTHRLPGLGPLRAAPRPAGAGGHRGAAARLPDPHHGGALGPAHHLRTGGSAWPGRWPRSAGAAAGRPAACGSRCSAARAGARSAH